MTTKSLAVENNLIEPHAPTKTGVNMQPASHDPDMNCGLIEVAALKGETAWALRFAQPLIDRGDASAQWYLGLMHHLGHGVKKDLTAAREWYEKAAAQGFSRAQDELVAMGTADRLGSGTDRKASPRRGSYAAEYDPKNPRCSEPDCERVWRWLYKGAARDDGDMQILLGAAYDSGVCVESNRDCALYWYRRACELGIEEGYKLLEEVYHRPGCDFDDYDALDCLEAKIVFILARSSQQRGVEPEDPVDALRWRLEAAEKGDGFAQWRLHELYLLGYGVREDHGRSAYWLRAACERHPDATVRGYFEQLRPRLDEVIHDHVLDVALRADLRGMDSRKIAEWL